MREHFGAKQWNRLKAKGLSKNEILIISRFSHVSQI